MVIPPAPTAWTIALSVLVFAALIAFARLGRRWEVTPRLTALLATSWAPVAAGIVTALVVLFVWRSFDEPGVVHDERAYLLQASIFASGRLTLPSPPIPAFFEQMHVFVEPAVFAKYPPGHALLLAPGVLLGLPGLIPALLTGLSGALVFWIARRLGNEWVGLFTWWLWTTAWANLYWAASYFSETSSMALWWLAVYAAIRWLDSGRPAFLIAVAASLAAGFHARPLTMVALALPLLIVIARRVGSVRAALTISAAPVAVGVLVLVLGPAWNQLTLGDWRVNPYSYYSEAYFPFDKPGFGVDSSPPLRDLPPELSAVGEWSREVHEAHVLPALPAALVKRFLAILYWIVDGWRLILGALILAAMRHGSAIERLGLAAVGVLLAAYLAFAHPWMWTLYYVEVLPILYFLASSQIGRFLHTFSGAGHGEGGPWPAHVTSAAALTAVLFAVLGASDLVRVRSAVDMRNAFHRTARSVIETQTPAPAIVFVHYPPDHNPHLGLTGNVADPRSDRWLVFDRGPRNEDLLSLAPGMPAFRLDTSSFHVEPLENWSSPRDLESRRSVPGTSGR